MPVVAVLCVLVATLTANILALLVKSGDNQGLLALLSPTTVARLTQALLIPLGFIWGGSRTAPSHQRRVGQMLFVISVLYAGAITFSGWTLMARPNAPGPIELVAQALLSVVGAYWGLHEAGLLQQRGPVPGWLGLLPFSLAAADDAEAGHRQPSLGQDATVKVAGTSD